MEVGISSAEAARLIGGEDVALEADQPLLAASSEVAPELADSGVGVSISVVTSRYRPVGLDSAYQNNS